MADIGDKSGRSGSFRPLPYSPRRGTVQAAQQQRACMGGRAVRTRVSDGPATNRSGCPCSMLARPPSEARHVG